MQLLQVWLEFAVCLGAIGLAGPVMTRNARVIAERTGLSMSWIGLALLATATSLPELFTGLSAVAIADAPNIAMGDALGSCLFNLVMLALLDALCRDEPAFWRRMDQGHILTAAFGVILSGFVGVLILITGSDTGLDFQLFHVSLYSPFLVLLYFVSMRAAFFYELRSRGSAARRFGTEPDSGPSLRLAILQYAAAGAVVAATGAYLPFVGLDIAAVMGWQTSFVGTLFVAAATSLPELIVTISALRMGSADMAIGNLLGSNLFAVLVIAIDDFAYRPASIFAAVSPTHAITAFVASIMAGLCIVGLLYRPGNRFFGVAGWISLSLLAVYVLASYAIYLHGH